MAALAVVPAAAPARTCGRIGSISAITATSTGCGSARAVARAWLRTLRPGRTFSNRIGNYRCTDHPRGYDAQVTCRASGGRRVSFYYSE